MVAMCIEINKLVNSLPFNNLRYSLSMKSGFWYVVLTLLILSCHSRSFAQNTGYFESGIRMSMANHLKRYPQEKIFIHTDCDLYAGGQTIWYKVYAMSYGKPSDLSAIVYVQLTDVKGRVLIKNKLPLKKGLAHGNIDLPDSLKTGWYQLTGLTAWMMNFGEEGFFHQKIYIQNLSRSGRQADKSQPGAKYHIAFFPEGGDPVEGNVCVMAFKATDQNGAPARVEGEILNNDKKQVAKIETEHDGMGTFGIEGEAGKANIAVVRFLDESVQTVLLPAFKKRGITWHVNALSPTNIELRIAFTGIANDFRDVVLVAFQNNGVFNTFPLQLSKGTNVFNISTSEFATGILRFTLYSQQGLPLTERVVFINKNDQLKLSLAADTLSFAAKSKSVFEVNAITGTRKVIGGNFSVSVTDAGASDGNMDDNIYSSLLLSSEIKGRVFNPDYYFLNNSDTLRHQLDLVMLTNGWRHFKLDSDSVKLVQPVEKSQFIAAAIQNYHEQLYAKKQPMVKLMIQGQDSSKYFGFVTPDTAGRFILNNYEHSGRSNLYLETADSKNRPMKLKIKLLYSKMDSLQSYCCRPLDTGLTISDDIKDYAFANALAEHRLHFGTQSKLLKTVYIKDKKLTPTQQIIAEHVRPLYTSITEYTLDLVDNPSINVSVIDYIKGRFPGLQIIDKGSDAYFLYHGSNTITQSPTVKPSSSNTFNNVKPIDQPEPQSYPYFYLNEAPIQFGDLATISLTDVALIRYLPPPVVFAPLNGGSIGALLIYTKNAKDDRRTLQSSENFDKYTFDGYTITREFSSSDYSPGKDIRLPDTRTTLYWNHDLNTDPSGNARFYFYNSDKAKHYRVVIQGMDAEGRIGYLSQVF